MSNRWETQRREVTCAAMEMASRGLVSGSSGNVSVRLSPQDAPDPLIAVTPSGKPYSDLEEADIVVVDQDGEPVEGDGVPSSETLLHLALYRARPDIAAVVHTHSLFASVAAVAGMEIPPILDEMATTLGGPVRVSEYGFPGSAELADKVALALGDRAAALIRNHGAVGVNAAVFDSMTGRKRPGGPGGLHTPGASRSDLHIHFSAEQSNPGTQGLHRGRAGHLQDDPRPAGVTSHLSPPCILVMERGAVDRTWRHS